MAFDAIWASALAFAFRPKTDATEVFQDLNTDAEPVLDRVGIDDWSDHNSVVPVLGAPTKGRARDDWDGTDAVTDATDLCPEMTATEAVALFMADVGYEAQNSALTFRRVRAAYDDLASRGGWPTISDKALSQHLVRLGCQKRKRPNGDRAVVFIFPDCPEVHQ